MTVEFQPGDLPDFYSKIDVDVHDEPCSPVIELARSMAEKERRLGRRPTVLFRNLERHPDSVVLANPCPKPVLLEAMGLHADHWSRELGDRLERPSPGTRVTEARWRSLSGLDALPVPHHRPGDAGRYVTAGVGVTASLDGDINLGVYRVQVVDRGKARIFFDPRTDAYRNWREHVAASKRMSVTVFIGASPVYLLAGASRLPVRGSDFDVAARLLGKPALLDENLGVPLDSQYVLTGTVGEATETEGPFAEFKGYYVPKRQSPVFEVSDVVSSANPYYPTIVTGAESGLTLMSLQNEYLMHSHLLQRGFPVESVTYPHAARAEFLALIRTPEPSEELLHHAMEFDTRAKVVACGDAPENFWQSVAAFGFSSVTDTYYRKGVEYGDRIGLVFDRIPDGWPVEF